MKIENEHQAGITRDWIKKFGDRLRMLEVERASLQGIVNDLHAQLIEYEKRRNVELAQSEEEST